MIIGSGTTRVCGASVQENYRKTTEVVRSCEENERGAYSEKNARRQPNIRWKDGCLQERYDTGRVERS